MVFIIYPTTLGPTRADRGHTDHLENEDLGTTSASDTHGSSSKD